MNNTQVNEKQKLYLLLASVFFKDYVQRFTGSNTADVVLTVFNEQYA